MARRPVSATLQRLTPNFGASPRPDAESLGPFVRHTSDVIFVLDADSTRRYVSDSVNRVLGYRPEELAGVTFFAQMHPDDAPRMLQAFLNWIESPGAKPVVEFRARTRDGEWRALEAAANNLLHVGDVGGVVVTARDISERRVEEDRLSYLAFHDPLTGLANRALYMDRLSRALPRTARTRERLAVMFVDLDYFKAVNDAFGHAAGDELLVSVAHRLQDCVRAGDTVARLGGDEFVILLEDLHDPSDAVTVATRTVEKLRQPFLLETGAATISGSVGIALSTWSDLDPNGLLRRADRALYEAKEAGRGCWRLAPDG